MKIALLSMVLLITGYWLQAQHAIFVSVVDSGEQEPLMGATVYIPKIDKGTITDERGAARIEGLAAGTYQVKVSFVGYQQVELTIETNSKTPVVVTLEAGVELEGIVLQATRTTRSIRNVPTRVELIGGEELSEKNMMNSTNISMVLRESTGIQMQQTSLSSANANIRIQGLDGRYTQLLKDGFPLYGGFSSGLSIMHIPPLDLKQFEIIKGSSSTLFGGGAIAGLVNLVSKVPEEEPALDIMFTQSHALGTTLNGFYAKKKGAWGWVLYGSGHLQKAYDPEDDGFSNLPQTRALTLNPKLFYYPSPNTTFWVGLNGTFDRRSGGDIAKIEDGQGGIHQYSEENRSYRFSSQAVLETKLPSGSLLKVKNSISFYDRRLEIPNLTFGGKQWHSFSEASLSKQVAKWDWVAGLNLYTNNFDENQSSNPRDQEDLTAGLFFNSIYDLSDHWILETGLRTDYARDWGFFPLPRVSLLFKTTGGFSSRIGGGLGYKIPDIFTEEASFINFQGIAPIDDSILVAERSYGVNLDFNLQTSLSEQLTLSVNQLFYVTAISEGLLLVSSEVDEFRFENASGSIISKGAETNIKFSLGPYRWFLNYALIDASLNYLPGNPQKPLTAKHNAGSVFMYESETWRLGLETYYTGQQILSNGAKTPDYLTMGFLAMRAFDWGNLFVNFENFTDRRQSRFSPLVLPPHENPTFPEIYAPTDGFIFSIGITVKPFGNETDHHE